MSLIASFLGVLINTGLEKDTMLCLWSGRRMCGGLEVQVNGSLSENPLVPKTAASQRRSKNEPEGGGARTRPPAERWRSAPSLESPPPRAENPLGRAVGPVALGTKQRRHGSAHEPSTRGADTHTTPESSTRDGISLTFVAEHIVHRRCTQHVLHMSPCTCTSCAHRTCASCAHRTCTSCAHRMCT